MLDALGIQHPLLIGHSFGGLVTLGWAARHPDRAAGIVIMDSPRRIGKEYLTAFKGWLLLNAMPAPALTAWYRPSNPAWGLRQSHRRARTLRKTARNVFVALRNDAQANDGIDRVADLAHLSALVLLVRGDPDTGSVVHPVDIEAFERHVTLGRVAPIPGAGHALHRERTGEFAAAAVPFLQECVDARLRSRWVGFSRRPAVRRCG